MYSFTISSTSTKKDAFKNTSDLCLKSFYLKVEIG